MLTPHFALTQNVRHDFVVEPIDVKIRLVFTGRCPITEKYHVLVVKYFRIRYQWVVWGGGHYSAFITCDTLSSVSVSHH